MTLRIRRPLSEMRPVLKKPEASGPDPVYEVYKDLDNGWVNKTILSAGNYGDEFAKTFGHIHADGKTETYHIESGDGLLVLQNAKNVFLVKAGPGEEVTITPEYEHAWVNIGNTPLVSYDDHRDPQDNYQPVADKHGLAYYIINTNGRPEAVVNPNYQNPPPPQWLTAAELNAQKL